jgi:hypothetical protein
VSLAGWVRVIGEKVERSGDRIGEPLQALGQFGAPGSAAATEQPLGAVECLRELVASFDRCGRGLRLEDGGGASREYAIEIGTADTDAAADPDGRELALIYPLSGLPDYVDRGGCAGRMRDLAIVRVRIILHA